MLTQTENQSFISPDEFDLIQRVAKAFHVSGMFPDIKSHAQAIVKVMAGKELGLPPFASIQGIHIAEKLGKVIIGANLIATMIANHPQYNYRVNECNREICKISFYNPKEITEANFIGISSFTIQEAQEAGLLGKDIWKKYPSDMLFARCITRGARRYAPGIFGGTPVYTPEEMSIEVDEDGVIMKDVILTPQTVSVPAMALEESGSDEAIIEEIKKTHVINEEFR